MSIFNTIKNRKKLLTKALVLSFLAPLVLFSAPQRSYAYAGVADIVVDPTNLVQNTISAIADTKGILKDFILDGIAWQIANMMIQKLTAQTVNWINSGFKGNPAYVTEPGKFFLDIGDNAASEFLSGSKFQALCSPFRAQIRLALVKNYLAETNNKNYTCTLDKIKNNYDSFMKDFSQGGWEGWFEITQRSENNPWGAYLEAKDALDTDIKVQVGKYQKQLDQGNGFLSFEKCPAGHTKPGPCLGTTVTNNSQCLGTVVTSSKCPAGYESPNGGTICMYDVPKIQTTECVGATQAASTQCVGARGPDTCDTAKETVTPGSVIQAQLSKAIGSAGDRLNISTSINQIVGALLTQLVGKVIGPTGLRDSSPTAPSTSQIQQLQDKLDQKTTELTPDPDAPLPSEEVALNAAGNAINISNQATTTATSTAIGGGTDSGTSTCVTGCTETGQLGPIATIRVLPSMGVSGIPIYESGLVVPLNQNGSQISYTKPATPGSHAACTIMLKGELDQYNGITHNVQPVTESVLMCGVCNLPSPISCKGGHYPSCTMTTITEVYQACP